VTDDDNEYLVLKAGNADPYAADVNEIDHSDGYNNDDQPDVNCN
jgi:hypothetical protein